MIKKWSIKLLYVLCIVFTGGCSSGEDYHEYTSNKSEEIPAILFLNHPVQHELSTDNISNTTLGTAAIQQQEEIDIFMESMMRKQMITKEKKHEPLGVQTIKAPGQQEIR